MSLIAYSLPDDTLETAALFLKPEEARQLDALLSIYTGIEDTSNKLNAMLLALSRREEGLPNNLLRLVVPTAWSLLDGLDRAFTIAQKMKSVTAAPAFIDIMKPLSLARNSFHHLEDRIEHFYASNQGSVFGDFYWRYRPSLSEEEIGVFFTTSPVFGQPNPAFSHGTLNLPNAEVAHETGVYDLRLFYIQGNPKNTVHKPLELSVDKALNVISSLMHFLHEYHKGGLEQFKASQPNKQLRTGRMPPMLLVMSGGGNNGLT